MIANKENTEKQSGALKINCESTDLGGSEAALNVKDAEGLRKRGGRREGSKATQTKTIFSCFEFLSLPIPTQLMSTTAILSALH